MNKKKLKEVTKSVQEYIPKRYGPAESIYQKRAVKAASDYKIKITELVNQLIGEYRKALKLELELSGYESKGKLNSQSPQDEEKRKKIFMFHLNKSGAYFNMKEELKFAVVQIVRERFRKKSPFAAKMELQLFMSEVYVYLVDEMHKVISNLYGDNAVECSMDDNALDSLKSFADDAEWNREIQLAARYHQERVAKFNENLTTWFDYSTFCMRNLLEDIGQEGLKEIIGRNDQHLEALLAYGMICYCEEKYEESKALIDQVLKIKPDSVVGNTFMVCYNINIRAFIRSQLMTFASPRNI